jgi:hypothetical protein
MENIQRVTAHQAGKASGDMNFSRRALTLLSTRTGEAYHRDGEGNYWRCYLFIEMAKTYDAVESSQQAFQAPKAFGQFQKMLADLPLPRLR